MATSVMVHALVKHLIAIARARRFRVKFFRRATFRTPESVRLGGKAVRVSSPEGEIGASIDFRSCFIDDEYGLSKIAVPVRIVLDIGANVGYFSMAALS